MNLSEVRDILIKGCTNGNSCLYLYDGEQPIVLGPVYEQSNCIALEGYVHGNEIVNVDKFLQITNRFSDKPITYKGSPLTLVDDSLDHELRIDLNIG
ncbi:MAG TPA: hypothetical protein DCW93_04595 [Saprospirales bacterium]|nr:hypothetical protein [Saprospirales bacterium]